MIYTGPLIDAHHHFWDLGMGNHPSRGDTPAIVARLPPVTKPPRDSATVSGAVISDEWARGRVSGVAYSLISNSTISALLCAPVPRARSISEMAGFGDRRISADSPGPNMLMSLL